MPQTSSLPSMYWSDRILCYYVNTTAQIQLARITNISGWLFERIVFPNQRLLFEAVPTALLEIYTKPAVELEQIPCTQLQVQETIHLSIPSSDFVDVGE